MFKGILSIGFIVLLVSIAQAKTIHVPGDFNKIQDAIDAASKGDTVLVAPGTYVENIDFIGKGITVKSEQGSDVTIIDGNQGGAVVTCKSGEGSDSVLDGFIIKNGLANYGGGVYCYCSSPTIKNNNLFGNTAESGSGIHCESGLSPTITNNTIKWNTANKDGGGIYCKSSSPTITDNIISGNMVTAPTASYGGGICCRDNSAPTITDNTITYNRADGGGGGIHCTDSSPSIANNTIKWNIADWGGGGIYCKYSSPTVTNNTISWNKVTDPYCGYGGGIYGDSYSSPIIANNTISSNSACHGAGMYYHKGFPPIVNSTISNNSASYGGGIFCCQGASLTIINTILWNNSAQLGQEAFIGYSFSPSVLTISFSDVKNGQTSCYVESSCTLNWGSGMINTDPLFTDPINGDYHLTWLSPCINRGTNDGAPLEDFEGDPRPYMGTVDMGADEFTGTHPLECDTFTISECNGGLLNFNLNGGLLNAGRNYLIYGSISGTAPGTPLPGGEIILPINWDLFTNIVASTNYPDSIIFTGFVGTLDSNGQMTAVFNTNGPVPGMAGYTVSFAYPLQGPPWDFVSNPVNVYITP